jgi:glycosyltransferase involved in cell wall biosynthesis
VTDATVTVVIPTLARRERASHLLRAIDSVQRQQGVRAVPLLVINGDRRDAELVRALHTDPRIRVIEHAQSGLPDALRAGCRAVDAPWFATLDDDDQLLAGALELRLRTLLEHDACDVVVTNGYRHVDGVNIRHVPDGAEVAVDPLRALLRANWLLPGSWLARSDRVGEELFDGMPRYLECTFLGARFATAYRMCWLDTPTVVYAEDSPLAESKSREYLLGQVAALRSLLALDLPDDVRHDLRARIVDACHTAANGELNAGRTREAWRWHAATLREPGGWRHISFARHLLRASLTLTQVRDS